MLEQIDGIIFDLDGTLVDSMWIWPEVDDEYLERYHQTKPEGFHEELEGRSYLEAAYYFKETFPDIPLSEQEIMDEWMDMVYDKYMTEVPLKKGAKEFIDVVRKRGLKLGIATSNELGLVLDTLKALEIEDRFDSVHSACEVASGKPAPDIYLLVAEELGIEPSRCLVFEDVPMGIMAGKSAGMKVCAVEDDFSRPQRVRKLELADYYIEDYLELLND
jgi:HAD superfamily hydrolase (TIGR01509 family)